ncbi:MAG: RagB/SusD family nutrient uptake outer membrane protein [Mucilaginibacter sp.]|nr:RagB/SusD family nutrient uptake outer membrane protein [Mucilaginibacter sp.]
MKPNYFKYAILLISLSVIGCQKNFLDKVPDKSLLVPVNLSDFQAILDNSNAVMNYVPYLPEIATDDIYITNAGFASQYNQDQNSYLWATDIFQGITGSDWDIPYQQVFYANIVLDGLKGFSKTPATQQQMKQMTGSALFYRAFAFYNVAQEFAAPYNSSTAESDLGIPLRLTSDVNEVSKRGTEAQTYAQIITDLTEAEDLLPETTPYKTRPTKIAALALLSRVYQTMQNYSRALQYASDVLTADNQLINYNALDSTAAFPLPAALPNGNSEVLFYSVLINNNFLGGAASLTSVDTTLYRSYISNDLRKELFFNHQGRGIYLFKGFYTGNQFTFAGLALDEVYLIRAECYARLGNTAASLLDLNTLLAPRFKTGTFQPFTASTADEALALVLTERRKELVYRNLRWVDLRRLNQDPRFRVTLHRNINGQTYLLAPNDGKYTFPIPNDVISNSGIQQNPR